MHGSGTRLLIGGPHGLTALYGAEPVVAIAGWLMPRSGCAAKRHQAVSGYWHSLATLARWCRIRSYLDSAAAHGIPALDAITGALGGKPWLPPLPAA